MDFKELRSAVMGAYRRRQYAVCFDLVDRFIDGAGGHELASALSLKASLILKTDHRRAAEGVTLVDEALMYAGQDPHITMNCLTNALGLCCLMGDVTRVEQYQIIWNNLLLEHANDPDVQAGQFRMHWNMGLIAKLRGEHATAYWRFVQAVQCLKTYGSEEGSNQTRLLFCLLILVADMCLHMHRWPEAEESLAEAKALVHSTIDRIEYAIARAKWLRYARRYAEADMCLHSLPSTATPDWTAETRAQYHLEAALLAAEQGDIRSHHHHLSVAQQEAEGSSLEYILSDIQRAQRMPVSLGVVD